jgi:hypothetical protein
MTDRRFPPPWTVEDLDARFVVKDCAGQKLTAMTARRFLPPVVCYNQFQYRDVFLCLA